MYKIIAITSGILFLLGIFIGFIGFPMLMKKMIKKQVNLKPGSEPRQMWQNFPIPVNFAVYVFNVTNPEETQNGGKPSVKEVGPFMFEEWKDKYAIEDNEEEDSVSFNMRNTFIFRPDLGLSGEEVITMPHPLLQVIAISIKREKAAMIKMVSDGLNVIFKPTSPFITAPFMDIFFRGFDIDCSNDHFAANAICLNFHSGVKGAVKIDDQHFKFSLLGGGNHSDGGRFKVARGIKNSLDIGKVLQFDDEDEMSTWSGDECNRFRGTDSTVFAPLMSPADGLWTFAPDLCRSLGPQFQHKVKYAGIPALRYVFDFGDVKNEPENRCYCRNYPADFPARGTMDLSPCNETPMIASLPHFFNADEKLIEAIDGLEPNKDKHMIYMDFEIISGTPLVIHKRLQFSLDVEPIPELSVMKDLRRVVMPLFWVEESLELNKVFTDMIKKKIFFVLKLNDGFKWTAVIVGGFAFMVSLLMLQYRQRRVQIDKANADTSN